EPELQTRAGARRGSGPRARQPAVSGSIALVLMALLTASGCADDPGEAIGEGWSWYGQGAFAKARGKFCAAHERLGNRDAGKAPSGAFDQACASHRKGDVGQARESDLKAGLAHDKNLAASAHFNLDTLAAGEAGRLAGEHPENVAGEKRQE